MTMTPQEAAALVGEQPDAEYALDLLAHPARYEKIAPKLAALLEHPTITAIRDRYLESDQQAIAAHTRYKNTTRRANLAVLLAATLSAFMMAIQIVLGSFTLAPYIVGTLGLLSALSAALAGVWLFSVSNGA